MLEAEAPPTGSKTVTVSGKQKERWLWPFLSGRDSLKGLKFIGWGTTLKPTGLTAV